MKSVGGEAVVVVYYSKAVAVVVLGKNFIQHKSLPYPCGGAFFHYNCLDNGVLTDLSGAGGNRLGVVGIPPGKVEQQVFHSVYPYF